MSIENKNYRLSQIKKFHIENSYLPNTINCNVKYIKIHIKQFKNKI